VAARGESRSPDFRQKKRTVVVKNARHHAVDEQSYVSRRIAGSRRFRGGRS
jgi:hypothetical protein